MPYLVLSSKIEAIMKKIILSFLTCYIYLSLFSIYPMTVLNTIDLANPLNTSTNIKGNGDLNGDGIKDLVLVRPIEGMQYYREVAVYFGGSPFDLNPDLIITSYAPTHINYESDLNGDGFDDLVISCPLSGYAGEGHVDIYFGGPGFDSNIDLLLEGDNYTDIYSENMGFGGDIKTSGDFNGDGYKDLLIVSSFTGNFYRGQANIFFGGPNFDSNSDWFYRGNISEEFATAITTGDINNDGYDDIASISGNCVDQYPELNYLQTLKIFMGSQNLDNSIDYTWDVVSPRVQLSLESDYNQDNFNDLLMDTVVDDFQILWGANSLPQYFQYILQEGGQKELMDDVTINNKPCIMYYSVCDTMIYLSSYSNQNAFVKEFFYACDILNYLGRRPVLHN